MPSSGMQEHQETVILMPTIFVNQDWARRIQTAKRDITERVGIQEPTNSQALDYILFQRLPRALSSK